MRTDQERQTFTNTTAFRASERLFKRELDSSQLTDLNGPSVIRQGNTFQFKDFPGLLLLKNHLDLTVQKQLVKYALQDWSKAPNLSNLDAHYYLPKQGIWNAFVEDPKQMIEHRVYQDNSAQRYDEELVIDPPTDAMLKKKPVEIQSIMNRLRWVTLGYQYNWTEKVYFFDRSPPFPPLANDLMKEIVKTVEPLTGYSSVDWKSEAGIVNFYHVLLFKLAR